MMRSTYILLIYILIGFAFQAQAQYETRQAIDFYNSTKIARGELKTMLTEKDIEGSPYLVDEFIEGTVFTTSKTQYVGILLRYNIFNGQIEFKTGDGLVQALAAPETVESIQFGDYKMVYIPYTTSRKIRRGFFREIEAGQKAVLLARPQVLFKEATEPAAYQEAEPPKFIRQPDDYFIRIGKEPAVLISRKKDMEEVFPEHKKEIRLYIKKNKVKPNKPERMVELVQYYNSL